MYPRPTYAFLLTACASAFAAASCGADAPGDNSSIDARSDEITEWARSLGQLPMDPERDETAVGQTSGNPAEDDGLICLTTSYTATDLLDNENGLLASLSNAPHLWSGNVLRGSSTLSSELAPLGALLAPVEFSLSLGGRGTMNVPDVASFRAELARLLPATATPAPQAMIQYEAIFVHHERDVVRRVGGGVGVPGVGGLAAGFEFGKSASATHLLFDFQQVFYTVDTIVGEPSGIFDSSVTADELGARASDGLPPVYVQQIAYGRRVLLSVTKETTSETEAATLKAGLELLPTVSATTELSETQRQALENVTIRSLVLGGDTDAATSVTSIEGLFAFIRDGGTFSAGAPGAQLGYRLAYLDSQPARFTATTAYEVRSCDYYPRTLTIQLKEIVNDGGEGSFDLLEGAPDWAGSVVAYYPLDEDNPSCGETPQGQGRLAFDAKEDVGGTWAAQDVPGGGDRVLCLHSKLEEIDPVSNNDFGVAFQEVSLKDAFSGRPIELLHDYAGNKARVELIVSFE